ncbi:hypothetical protein AFMFED_17780 [Klebsiella pneumoniae]
MKKQHNYTVMHWGTWQVESREGEIVAVKPVPWDKNPSRIGQSLPDAVTSQTRIRRPAVRAGYLQHGPASREGRGKEPFVEVSWEVALDLLARELRSVKARCGNEAIYGGSYGWASAGRFICSPASRAPACTVSTTTAASAGRRKFRDASRCGCIRAMRREGISAKAAW